MSMRGEETEDLLCGDPQTEGSLGTVTGDVSQQLHGRGKTG